MSSDLVAIALNQTALWEKNTGLDGYGQPSFATGVDIPCRVSVRTRLVLNPQGDETVSNAQVTTLAAVEIGDRLTVDGRTWPVIDVRKPATFTGQVQRRKAYI